MTNRRDLLVGSGLGVAALAAGAVLSEAEAQTTSAVNVRRDQTLAGGISLTSGRHVFENCTITGGGNAIAIGGTAEVALVNCHIRDCTRAGVYVTSTGHVQILNNHIYRCGENGVRIQSATPSTSSVATRTLVQGNYIHDITAPWGDGGTGNAISIWKAHNVQVIGNRCEAFVYSAVRNSDGHNTTVIGNHCSGGQRDSQVYFEFAFYGAVVANNYFGNGGAGLEVTNFTSGDGGVSGGRQALVTGNRFQNFRMLAAKLEADVIFTDNIIDGVQNWGVLAGWNNATRNLTVANNLFMNCKWGVGLTTVDSDPVYVEGNRFSSTPTAICNYIGDWARLSAGTAALPLSSTTRHILRNNFAGATALRTT